MHKIRFSAKRVLSIRSVHILEPYDNGGHFAVCHEFQQMLQKQFRGFILSCVISCVSSSCEGIVMQRAYHLARIPHSKASGTTNALAEAKVQPDHQHRRGAFILFLHRPLLCHWWLMTDSFPKSWCHVKSRWTVLVSLIPQCTGDVPFTVQSQPEASRPMEILQVTCIQISMYTRFVFTWQGSCVDLVEDPPWWDCFAVVRYRAPRVQ